MNLLDKRIQTGEALLAAESSNEVHRHRLAIEVVELAGRWKIENMGFHAAVQPVHRGAHADIWSHWVDCRRRRASPGERGWHRRRRPAAVCRRMAGCWQSGCPRCARGRRAAHHTHNTIRPAQIVRRLGHVAAEQCVADCTAADGAALQRDRVENVDGEAQFVAQFASAGMSPARLRPSAKSGPTSSAAMPRWRVSSSQNSRGVVRAVSCVKGRITPMSMPPCAASRSRSRGVVSSRWVRSGCSTASGCGEKVTNAWEAGRPYSG